MHYKKQTGFTLLEILIVVVIIGILGSLSVPAYNKIIRRSNVSDAMYNLDMLATAESKYFIANGRYTSNLSNLETPLKGNSSTISTKKFTYSAGEIREGNYCIYSESNDRDFILARNYKTNLGILCSGSYCSNLSGLVKTGSLSRMCGSTYNGQCDMVCSEHQILDEAECNCSCDISYCGALTIQNSESCDCSCKGQAVMDPSIDDTYACTCPSTIEESCTTSGRAFNAENCDCGECIITDEICKLEGSSKIVDSVRCECVESSCESEDVCYENNANGHFDYRNCECVCDLDEDTCRARDLSFNPTTCECHAQGKI